MNGSHIEEDVISLASQWQDGLDGLCSCYYLSVAADYPICPSRTIYIWMMEQFVDDFNDVQVGKVGYIV